MVHAPLSGLSLSRENFAWVLSRLPFSPAIDLFATSLNFQLPRYVSPYPEPQALAFDALGLDWSKLDPLYAFPPTNLVKEVVAKLQLYPRPWPFKIALIAPFWPNQPWFSTLLELLPMHEPIPNVKLHQDDEHQQWKCNSSNFFTLHCWQP